MSRREHQKLADIQANNERLYRARLPGETLADALEYRQPKRAGPDTYGSVSCQCGLSGAALVPWTRSLPPEEARLGCGSHGS
jgi:hypothetical protein